MDIFIYLNRLFISFYKIYFNYIMSDNLVSTKTKESLNSIKCKKIGDYVLGKL